MKRRTARRLLYGALALLYLLHNDLWLWDDGRLVLGLPVGLVYHLAFCGVVMVFMILLVRFAWPETEDAGAESQ